MTKLDVESGFIVRGSKSKYKGRDWWLLKTQAKGKTINCTASLSTIYFPKEYIGRRVKFKVILLDKKNRPEPVKVLKDVGRTDK